MWFILVTFVLLAASLTVILWVATLFLQGYFYTQPTEGIHWQAPAAGSAVAVVLTFWCLLLVNAAAARPGDLPYDTLFRFSPREDQFQEPVKELWAVRKNIKEPILYKRKKVLTALQQPRFEYFDSAAKPWNPTGIVKIIINDDGTKRTFDLKPRAEGEGAYRQFVDESGWTMIDYGREGGPSGIPMAFRWGRFFMNLFLNFLHWAAWFVSLWLLLRFTWPHALGLSMVLWLVMTLTILPMVFEQATLAGQRRATETAATAGFIARRINGAKYTVPDQE